MHALRSLYHFLSLPPFHWEAIRPLTVITGANGIGKSHLLLLLAADLGGKRLSRLDAGAVEIDGSLDRQGRPRLVGYLPATWSAGLAQASAKTMYLRVDGIVDAARNTARRRRLAPNLEPISTIVAAFEDLSRLSPDLAARLDERGERVTHADVLDALGQYHFVEPEPADPIGTLARVFFAHASARVTHLLQGKAVDVIDALVGRPPWRRAAELLQTFDLGFTVEPPIDVRFEYTLTCRLRTGEVVAPGDLSSGERAVLALVATIVVGETLGDQAQGPGLLLLDEPDAHIHTSLIKDYLEHLQQLADRGFQILMVTHRPETMLLCPPDSLVELRRTDGQLTFEPVPPAKRPALIARLAGDTVAVLPNARVVLVEDEADRRFHQGTYDRAVKLGLLPANPRLAFMPVVAKKGGGGKAAVRKRVEELAAEGLLSIHRGLIDRDGEDDDLPPGVLRHDRYAIENFFADPIALYCAMVNASELDDHVGWSKVVGLRRGDLAELRRADAAQLQRVADHVIAAFTSSPGLPDLDRTALTLHGDAGAVVVSYPRWVFDTSKADLRTAIGKLHPKAGPGVLNAEHLTGGPELSGLVPADLLATYHRLITERL